MTWLDAIWFLVSMLTESGPPSGLLLLAALAVGLVLLFRGAGAIRPANSGHAWRTRVVRAGVPRYRDPDAPGRTRPRGPTARPLAAA